MSEVSNKFKFRMAFTKSLEKGGKKHIQAKVSDTRLDYHTEHMAESALSDMCGMLKTGTPVDGGGTRPVLLLPDHNSTFEIGYGVDGWIEKAQDGHMELFAEFEMIEGDVHAEKLYKAIEDGTCDKQLSVGGAAIGHKYWNEQLQKSARSLDSVVELEHVACTRASRSAVSSAGFLSAMMKSLDGIAEATPLEKKAMTDSERKKSAVLTLDNDRRTTMLADGDKVHLFPIPDGDKNAAKVALQDLSSYPLTRQEKKAVHDRAKEVLGDEHAADGYCYMCSYPQDFEDDKGDLPLQKNNATSPQVQKTKTGAGDEDMEKSEVEAIVKGLLAEQATKTDEKFGTVTSLLEKIAEKNGLTVKEPTEGEKAAALIKSAITEALEPLTKLRPRQAATPGVAAGAGILAKSKTTTVNGKTVTLEDVLKALGAGASEGDGGGEGDAETETGNAELDKLTKQRDTLQEKMDDIVFMTKSGHKFSQSELTGNRRVAEQFRGVQSKIRAIEVGAQ